MKRVATWSVLGLALVLGPRAGAAEPVATTPPATALPASDPPACAAWAPCCPPACECADHGSLRAPTMFGDIIAILIGVRNGTSFAAPAPIAVAYGAVKVAENESPLPQDRAFVTDNFYSNVLKSVDFHRQTLGFEKTFLNGDASFGMRLPFFEIDNSNHGKVDDLDLLFKYLVLNDADTGTALSTGLVVTAPTGAAFVTPTGQHKHITLLQPYVGYLWAGDRAYFHGFSSLVVPSDAPAPTVLFNDLGVGYWLYRGCGILQGVVPTFETHVNTPLSKRDADPLLRRVDAVDLTLGTHFVLCNGSSAGIGVATPVTGPRLFDVEVLAQVNFRF